MATRLPFGEMSRKSGFDRSMKWEIGGSFGLMAVLINASQPRILNAPTLPEVMNANAGNVSTMLQEKTSSWLEACIHSCTDMKVMGHGSMGPDFCQKQLFLL